MFIKHIVTNLFRYILDFRLLIIFYSLKPDESVISTSFPKACPPPFDLWSRVSVCEVTGADFSVCCPLFLTHSWETLFTEVFISTIRLELQPNAERTYFKMCLYLINKWIITPVYTVLYILLTARVYSASPAVDPELELFETCSTLGSVYSTTVLHLT